MQPFSFVNSSPGGNVPCLGLGPATSNEINVNTYTTPGEVTGICFQKVDTGTVKAALPLDGFVPVNWADAPTKDAPPVANEEEGVVRRLNNRLNLGQVPANDVKQEWREFADAMARVKQSMLKRVSKVAEFIKQILCN